MLVRVVRQLVADDDGQLVVGHVVHDAVEDPDGAVAHRHRVPLFVVDDIDANLRLVDIRRRHATHQATDAIDGSAVTGNFADDLATSSPIDLEGFTGPQPQALELIRAFLHVALEEGVAVRTNVDFTRQDRAIDMTDAAHADFVAERNVVDGRGFALPTCALIRSHALAIDQDQPRHASTPRSRPVDRVLCSADRQSSGSPTISTPAAESPDRDRQLRGHTASLNSSSSRAQSSQLRVASSELRAFFELVTDNSSTDRGLTDLLRCPMRQEFDVEHQHATGAAALSLVGEPLWNPEARLVHLRPSAARLPSIPR